MKKVMLFTMVMFLCSLTNVNAQKKFEKNTEKDGVSFMYKWKSSELFKKDAPLALVIKMENKNDYTVKVTFNVNYYWGMDLKATSSTQEAIIKSKKVFTHNLKKKGFDNFSFSNEDLKDDNFSFEIVKINVEKIEENK